MIKKIGLLLIFYSSGILAQTSISFPIMPNPPTIEGCHEFIQQRRERIHQILEAKSICYKTTSVKMGRGKECMWSSNRVRTGFLAWPHCTDSTAEEECTLLRKSKDIGQCFKSARQEAQENEKHQLAIEAYNKAENNYHEVQSHINDIQDAWNNPRRFMKEKIGQYVRSQLLVGLQDNRGDFTDRGKSLTQETYDFIFSKTAGNRSLYSSNPIIAAIQDSAANEIRNAHGMAISQIEKIQKDIDKIGRIELKSNPGSHSRSTKRRAPNSSNSDECAILDRPESGDLAIDHPDRFEILVSRCQ